MSGERIYRLVDRYVGGEAIIATNQEIDAHCALDMWVQYRAYCAEVKRKYQEACEKATLVGAYPDVRRRVAGENPEAYEAETLPLWEKRRVWEKGASAMYQALSAQKWFVQNFSTWVHDPGAIVISTPYKNRAQLDQHESERLERERQEHAFAAEPEIANLGFDDDSEDD